MQFDIDMQGLFSELFLELRDILLSQPGVIESLTEKQTSYRYQGRVICMLRSKDNFFILAFNFGHKLHQKHKQLHMTGKTVAHWKIYHKNEFNKSTFKEIIHESIGYTLEAQAQALMRCKGAKL